MPHAIYAASMPTVVPQDLADARSRALAEALRTRVVVADGAMGTMIQEQDPTLEDYQGLEGCNEILNVSRPDIIAAVHDAYLEVGVDAIETNTFGANWSNLSDYDIDDRIRELAAAGARIARERADAHATADHPRWVLGSMGPGTKLPSLGHTTYAHLRDTFAEQAAGLLEGGVDAILVETSQDLLQAKAAVTGSRNAMRDVGREVPVIVQVTVETTGTMLMGSEIGAALTTLQALGVDAIGLNCATGPAEMSEHLRHLSRHAEIPVTCMPNAGLPVLGPNGATYPLTPDELAAAHTQFVTEFGLGLVGGCCGTTPEHLRRVVEAVRARPVVERHPERENGVASLYSHTDLHQDASFLAIGERTNANGSKAFREAMLAENWEECVEIARAQTRDGAHLLDVCIDYVGRDGVADVQQVVSRLASASTLPLVIDSTEPEVIAAGLELVGGRAVVNSVNFEDGDGPTSRFARIMPHVVEHGAAVVALTIDEEGQARTASGKVEIATRLVETLTRDWGMRVDDIIVDALTFPIATGQEETRRDAIETIEAIREITRRYPGIHTTLGVSNVSFGLNPAARTVLNSVFLHEAVEAGLDSAIVHAAKILPLAQIPAEQREAALDLVWDRRRYDDEGNLVHDPLARLLELFDGVDSAALKDQRAAELAALPVGERLERRIVDGARKGLEEDLDAAMASGIKALRDRQRPPARGHEGRGRPVRPRRDAAPVRAAVRRGHEDRGRLPRAAHGEDRGLERVQGHDRARDRARRRARHRQEPRRHHPHQQRLHGREHRYQAADLRDDRGRRGARRRRHRHVRAAREVDRRDEGEPRGAHVARARRPLADPAGWRGAHPHVRRGRPGGPVPRRRPVRARRVRGPAPHGAARAGRARRVARRRRAARAEEASARRGHRDRDARRGPARAVRRRGRQPGARSPVLGHAPRQGCPARRVRGVPRRARDVHGPVGAQARPG